MNTRIKECLSTVLKRLLRDQPVTSEIATVSMPSPYQYPKCVMKIDVQVRWMIRRDMSTVLDIENQCFEFPWTEKGFISCLRQRNCIGMVAEVDDQVVGFMIYELHKNRLHILNFAVHRDHRRQGVGKALLNKLFSKLSHERRNRIMVEVRETDLDAQLFFKSAGFRAISVLRDYYEDTVEDAYLMQFRYQGSDNELSVPHNRIAQLRG